MIAKKKKSQLQINTFFSKTGCVVCNVVRHAMDSSGCYHTIYPSCMWIQSTVIHLTSCLGSRITTCLRAWGIDEEAENVTLCFTDFGQRRYPFEPKRNKGQTLFVDG